MAQTESKVKRRFDWGTAGVVSLVVGLLLTTFDFLWALLKAPMVNGALGCSQSYVIGGVGIDHQARVLTVHGKPIEGLYAAGEVTGGAHGASRLGGCAIADGLVFGRIAADTAVAAKPAAL